MQVSTNHWSLASASPSLAPIVLAVSHTSASPVLAGDVVLTLQLSLQCHVDTILKHHPVSQSVFSSLHEPDSFSSFSHGTQSSVSEVRSLLADTSVRTSPTQPYIMLVFHRFSILFCNFVYGYVSGLLVFCQRGILNRNGRVVD